jgi:hypothetical protein
MPRCGAAARFTLPRTRLRPDQFYRVYPRYRELLTIKRRLDPEGLFTSDLARRVGIDPVLNQQWSK